MLKLKKKFRGSMFVELVCSIPIVIVITVILITPYVPAINKSKAQIIYRKYMFSMVKDGYLTDINRQNMISELQSSGFKNVTIQANNEKVKWGEGIRLKVEFDMPVNKFKSLKEGFSEDLEKIEIDKESISLS